MPRAGGSYSVVALSAGQITREQLHEVSRTAVDIDDFDLLAAGPLKCMRRDGTQVRRTSIIRARNFWIGGRALPSYKSCTSNDRHSSTGRDCNYTQQIAGRFINRGCSRRAGFFRKACFRSACFRNALRGRGPKSATTTEAVPARRRSHQRRPVVEQRRGCFEMRAGRRHDP